MRNRSSLPYEDGSSINYRSRSAAADAEIAGLVTFLSRELSSAHAMRSTVRVYAPTPNAVYEDMIESLPYRYRSTGPPTYGELLFPTRYRDAINELKKTWNVTDLPSVFSRDFVLDATASILAPVPPRRYNGPSPYIDFRYGNDVRAASEALKKSDAKYSELVKEYHNTERSSSSLDRTSPSDIRRSLDRQDSVARQLTAYSVAMDDALFVETNDSYLRSTLFSETALQQKLAARGTQP